MIPKKIHYCWFGRNPLPESAKKCIDSWRNYLPDYEIKEWNEDNFDVNIIPYTEEAYRLKKYAFVSDYARFWILYKYGGLYFDTDVEVIKNMDDIIARGPFMGIEAGATPAQLGVAPGLGLGVNPGLGLYKEMLNIYKKKHFTTWTGIMEDTVVTIMTRLLSKKDKVNLGKGICQCGGIYLYAPEYFCPKNYYTGEMNITDRTVCIHHYSASWVPPKRTILQKIVKRMTFIIARLSVLFKNQNKWRNYNLI